MATIELVNVSHRYNRDDYAVKNINLKWEAGASTALLGPSGCGKTTLLKIISGLLRPSEGQVLIDGEEVNHKKPKDRRIAQIFQFPVVYETLNVYQNLAFPLRNQGMLDKLAREHVLRVADLLELTDNLQENSASLSPADKQLVSLGRSIIREDLTALLLDEPLTVIDPHQKWHIRRKLKQLQERVQGTMKGELIMIYVTHDQHEALTFADQVTVMNFGHVVQTGSPEDLHERPQTPFVGYFIGSPGMNIFDAVLSDGKLCIGKHCIPVPASGLGRLAGSHLKLGIRPEYVDVQASASANSIPCTVQAVHHTGSAKILELSGADLKFRARVPDFASIDAQSTVWASFPAKHTMIYVDEQALPMLEEEKVP
jgi:glycerol transport system ATP-binding protein